MLVSVGLGWGVLPLSMVADPLVCVELPAVYFYRQLGLVTHPKRSLSRAAQAFCELLRGS